MTNIFFKDFSPTIELGSVTEKPFENGQQYLREFFTYMQIRNSEKIEQAVQIFTPAIYKKGELFLSKGKVSEKIGFIIKGGVEVFIEEEEKQHILLFLTEEYFFADMKSFLNQQPSKLNIKFAELSIVLEVAQDDFKNFISENPEFGTMVMRIMSNVTATITQFNMTLKLPGKTRYEKLLKLQPQLFNRFLLQDIASFLGVKQETLSRIRHQLRNGNKAMDTAS